MTTSPSRAAEDVFKRHARAMVADDMDDIVSDHADDALFITNAGILHGRAGVREGFTKIFADLPNARCCRSGPPRDRGEVGRGLSRQAAIGSSYGCVAPMR